MTAINHALTGAVIGLTFSNPITAVVGAFASHFILDALPHFGFRNLNERGRRFGAMLLSDMLLCYILVALLVILQPEQWFIACIAAFAAASPDFMWAPDYIRTLRGKNERGVSNPLKWFHSVIQWYQKPPGAFLELLYAVAIIALLATLIKN